AAPDIFRSLVHALVEYPYAWDRPVAPDAPPERNRARAARAPAGLPPAPPRTLPGRFFEHARTAPAATVLIAPDGTETGYGALADRALRVAGAVAAAAAPGETVAVHLPKGADQVAAVLGVLAAGCAYLPVGRDHPPARRRR